MKEKMLEVYMEYTGNVRYVRIGQGIILVDGKIPDDEWQKIKENAEIQIARCDATETA